MGTVTWDAEWAQAYDSIYAATEAPEVLDPMVGLLADLAGHGRALEFAIGTGRVALALHARGVEVAGIELSPHMVTQLRGKDGADEIEVTVGDMATTRLGGTFRLVYLVANSIMNVTTQEEQCAVFENAARHLEPGGSFVVELMVPQPERVPPGEKHRVFTLEPDHIGIESFEDRAGQVAWSHHWIDLDGRLVRHSAPYRYVWPPELDLMARLAGLIRRDRWAGWTNQPFTSDSVGHVSVYQKPA